MLKKLVILCLCLLSLSSVVVPVFAEEVTVIDQTKTIADDSYWSQSATFNSGFEFSVSLEVTSGNSVDLLLMDEATVGLDPASRQFLLNNVHQLCAERGLAVLWATHLIDEAETAHQVVILHQGEILISGTPDEVSGQDAEQSLSEAFMRLTKKAGVENE